MIYVFLADGFEEAEALVTVDVLRRAKYEVKTVGVTGEFVTGNHGITVKSTALSCGFSDPLYFSKVFRKTYGISPGEFAKLQ